MPASLFKSNDKWFIDFFLKRNGTSDLYGEGPFMVIALNQSAELFKDKTTVHFAIENKKYLIIMLLLQYFFKFQNVLNQIIPSRSAYDVKYWILLA